jgi:plastocyanin
MLLAACGAIAVAGCGSDDSGPSPAESASGSSTGSATPTDKVEIKDYKYLPEQIQVDAGSEVTFSNEDATKHTATADDGSFDTGDLDQGDAKSVTLDAPGTFTYYCRFHPFMKATVEVR